MPWWNGTQLPLLGPLLLQLSPASRSTKSFYGGPNVFLPTTLEPLYEVKSLGVVAHANFNILLNGN
jgi:hypothetical protein